MPSDVAESQQGCHPAAGRFQKFHGKMAMECHGRHGYAIVSEKLRNDVRNIRIIRWDVERVEHLCKQGEVSGG